MKTDLFIFYFYLASQSILARSNLLPDEITLYDRLVYVQF